MTDRMVDPTPRLIYTKGHELPSVGLTWLDDDDHVVNFSGGWTFTLTVGTPGRTAEHEKISGLIGAATAPNLTIIWSENELDDVDAGTHRGQLTAHHADGDRGPFPLTIEIYEAISAPPS